METSRDDMKHNFKTKTSLVLYKNPNRTNVSQKGVARKKKNVQDYNIREAKQFQRHKSIARMEKYI